MDAGRMRASSRPVQSGHRLQAQAALHSQRWQPHRPGQRTGLRGNSGGGTGRVHVRQPPRVHAEGRGVAGAQGGVLQHPGRRLRPNGSVQDGAVPVLRPLRPAAGLPAEPGQEGAGGLQR